MDAPSYSKDNVKMTLLYYKQAPGTVITVSFKSKGELMCQCEKQEIDESAHLMYMYRSIKKTLFDSIDVATKYGVQRVCAKTLGDITLFSVACDNKMSSIRNVVKLLSKSLKMSSVKFYKTFIKEKNATVEEEFRYEIDENIYIHAMKNLLKSMNESINITIIGKPSLKGNDPPAAKKKLEVLTKDFLKFYKPLGTKRQIDMAKKKGKERDDVILSNINVRYGGYLKLPKNGKNDAFGDVVTALVYQYLKDKLPDLDMVYKQDGIYYDIAYQKAIFNLAKDDSKKKQLAAHVTKINMHKNGMADLLYFGLMRCQMHPKNVVMQFKSGEDLAKKHVEEMYKTINYAW